MPSSEWIIAALVIVAVLVLVLQWVNGTFR